MHIAASSLLVVGHSGRRNAIHGGDYKVWIEAREDGGRMALSTAKVDNMPSLCTTAFCVDYGPERLEDRQRLRELASKLSGSVDTV